MANSRELMAELRNESASTRKMLERVPTDKFDWRIHEKSMTLGRLATHVAEMPVWINRILEADTFDFAAARLNPQRNSTTEEILSEFDQRLAAAVGALENTPGEALDGTWTVKRGEQVLYQFPKKVGIRSFALNHLYHHRGQLSVYLRLLNIPVPGMYGPSADEQM